MTRAVFVTNIPAPYREPVHEAVHRRLGADYHVVYAAKREPNRSWDLPAGNYERTFLTERFVTYRDRYIHWNPDAWSTLDRLDPEVVITSGFNPTMLIAFAWSIRHGRAHVPFTDGWRGSERHLSLAHRMVRRLVVSRSRAFIGASLRSLELFRHYGAADAALFQSHLCVDNERFARVADHRREFDLMFCGQVIPRKLPGFFADVAARVHQARPGIRVLVVGDGPGRDALLASLGAAGIDVTYAGFVQQAELPERYASCRLLLFPTEQDPWGVVANEACAAAVPVITCPNAGVAGELVVHEQTGLVLDLDPALWSSEVLRLLANPQRLASLGQRARAHAAEWSSERAAAGIIDAIHHASAPHPR